MNLSKEMAKIAYKALDDKMGIDIQIIEIGKVSIIADYFIIASAANSSQLLALSDSVEEELDKVDVHIKQKEGNNTGWILMDYGDIIVHVFTEEDRHFYNLERIWSDGRKINVNDL